jgi:heme/copper-type cytochrome/quinol oxidase subunit 2
MQIPFNPITNFQRGFQTPASPIAEGISAFHNDLRVLVRFILFFVITVLYHILTAFARDVKTDEQNNKDDQF